MTFAEFVEAVEGIVTPGRYLSVSVQFEDGHGGGSLKFMASGTVRGGHVFYCGKSADEVVGHLRAIATAVPATVESVGELETGKA